MRNGMKPEAIYYGTKNQHFWGFNLSSDFCAEHEWGIKDINRAFGIESTLSENNVGINRFKVNEIPEDCVLFEKKGNKAILVFDKSLRWAKEDGKEKDYFNHRELRTFRKDVDVFSAWSGNDFAILVTNKKLVNQLEELYNELLKKNVVIWVGGQKAFDNGGLIIAIHDKTPKIIASDMEEADVDRLALLEESKHIGIVEKIDKINKEYQENNGGYDRPLGYHALSPRWAHEEELKKTKHKVMYWLNPMNQRERNFGWFTVEELEQWIQGTGPILMDES